VVAEEVVAPVGVVDDALIACNFLGRRGVGDAEVCFASLEVFNGEGCVAEDPADGEGLGAVGYAFLDERVGEDWRLC
jgi:hypothetical protein